jgi:hypothetical protein
VKIASVLGTREMERNLAKGPGVKDADYEELA